MADVGRAEIAEEARAPTACGPRCGRAGETCARCCCKEAPPQERESGLGGVSGWIAEHTTAAVTVVGLLLYGGARLSHSSFYGAFGVEPEEAGVSYGTTLARAAPGMIAIFLATALLALFLYVVLLLITPAEQRRQRRWPFWLDVPVFAVGVVVFVFVLWLPSRAADMAEDVKGGEELIPSLGIVDGDLFENPFGLRAERVRVRWVQRDAPVRPRLPSASTVMYLGRSGDTVVLYVPEGEKRTLRIPAALIVLSDPDEADGDR